MTVIASSEALDIVTTATVVCTYFPVLAGSWRIFIRFKTISTKIMFFCTAALPAWIILTKLLFGGMSRIEEYREVVAWIPTIVTCLLFVTPAIAFLFFFILLCRANNSSKPTPLRGSA